MVIAERIVIEQNAREGGFQMADLSIAAVNFTRRDNEGNVIETNHTGLLNHIVKNRNIPKDEVLGHSQGALELLSVFGEQKTSVPFRVEHLRTIWDVTFHLTNRGYFDSEGNLGEFDPGTVIEEISANRRRSRTETLGQIEGSRSFLAEFIAVNT